MNMPVMRLRTPLDYVRRKWERVYLSFETTLSTYRGLTTPVRVINFSEGGFLIQCDERLERGDAVMIELHGVGKVTGRIAWSANGHAGGSFDDMIGAHELIATIESEQSVVPTPQG
jgi:PilZ domain